MFNERLRELRKKKSITQVEFAKAFNISNGTIGMWETGQRQPDFDTVQKIAAYFNVSIDYLLGECGNIQPISLGGKGVRIPVLGNIPAGTPIEMIEDILDYEDIPQDWLTGNKEYFALKIAGDSMSPRYLDGDVLIILKTPDCESGKDVIVNVNGYDATFKRLIKKPDGIILQPLNSDYEPQIYTSKQAKELPITILGVVVEIRRKV